MFTRNTTDALNLLAGCVPGPGADGWTSSTTRTCWPGGAGRVLRRPRATVSSRPSTRCAPRSPPSRARAGRRHRRVQRHRRGAAAGRDRRARPRRRRPGGGRRRPAGAAPARSTSPRTGVDYLALSGHKLYAPYGAGVLVGRRDWLDAAPPYLAGGGAVRAVAVAGDAGATTATWAPAPAAARGRHPERARRRRARRGLPGARARDRHGRPGPRARAARPARAPAWTQVPGRARRCGSGRTAPTGSPSSRSSVDGCPAGLVAACAVGRARHRRARRDVLRPPAARPARRRADGAVRASLGLGTTTDDVDRLVDALATLARSTGRRWTYAAASTAGGPDARPARPRPPAGRGARRAVRLRGLRSRLPGGGPPGRQEGSTVVIAGEVSWAPSSAAPTAVTSIWHAPRARSVRGASTPGPDPLRQEAPACPRSRSPCSTCPRSRPAAPAPTRSATPSRWPAPPRTPATPATGSPSTT